MIRDTYPLYWIILQQLFNVVPLAIIFYRFITTENGKLKPICCEPAEIWDDLALAQGIRHAIIRNEKYLFINGLIINPSIPYTTFET